MDQDAKLGSIRCKHMVWWPHLSRVKNVAFALIKNFFDISAKSKIRFESQKNFCRKNLLKMNFWLFNNFWLWPYLCLSQVNSFKRTFFSSKNKSSNCWKSFLQLHPNWPKWHFFSPIWNHYIRIDLNCP